MTHHAENIEAAQTIIGICILMLAFLLIWDLLYNGNSR